MRYLILILLVGCVSYPPSELAMSPFECRQYGVDVRDDDEVTGTVVISQAGSMGLAYKHCGGGSACTTAIEGGWPSESHQYEIYYTNKDEGRHEACHALYERYNHTDNWVINVAQGWKL
jgi:hypothetical protein